MSPGSRRRVAAGWLRLAAVWLVCWSSASAPAAAPALDPAAPAVRLELLIPPAESYVIGDFIPLTWRFRNDSTQSLAFMWEGCCRLNGRLEVAQGGATLESIPPGQSTAHRFARAETVPPGTTRDFATRVSDWVRLDRSGTFTLRGRYTGVLPEQRPQTARGIELWRGTAYSTPLELGVLTVADYLAQRASRSGKRAVRLEVSGPPAFHPLSATPFSVHLSNVGTNPATLAWPADFDLWLVRSDGVRIETLSGSLEADAAAIELAPGQSVQQGFSIDPSRLEGEPLGDVLVFVELRPRPSDVRVPSNALTVAWNLNADTVLDLLQRAAAGPAAGSRNAPLKRLRVYLREIEQHLAAIDATRLDAAAVRLRSQLLLAAALKPLAPAPGTVEVTCTPTDLATGVGSWRISMVASNPSPSLAEWDAPEAMRRLCEVRRHLGWEPRVRLVPQPATALNAVAQALREFEPLQAELADSPGAVLLENGVPLPGVVRFGKELPPRGMAVRMRPRPENGAWIVEVRDAAADAAPSAQEQPVQAGGWRALAAHQPLDHWLTTQAGQRVSLAVLAAPTLTWGQVRHLLLPFAQQAVPALLVMSDE